jgi:hypothetical protein
MKHRESRVMVYKTETVLVWDDDTPQNSPGALAPPYGGIPPFGPKKQPEAELVTNFV